MFAELICDSCAIHVNADMQRLLISIKGVNKMILITDSTSECHEVPEEMKHITDLNFDYQGGLSGSRLTMDMACKNIMTHTSCGIVQAFLMGALNPAKAIGMDQEIGSIAPGKKADIIFVDDQFNVKKVILQGKLCAF